VSQHSHSGEILTQLASEIAGLRAQMERAQREQAELDQIVKGTRGGSSSRLPAAPDVVREMASRIQQLQQIQTMIEQNPDIVRVIDTVIGKRIYAAERRQHALTIALSLFTLIAGWLLSLVRTPTDVFMRFLHF
jgi:hypothetical protein